MVSFTTAKGEEKALPAADDIKVWKGRIDRDTKDVEAVGDPIEGGLTNSLFTKLGDKGVKAAIVTDSKNKKVAEIYLLPAGRKGP